MKTDTGYRVPGKPGTLTTHRLVADSRGRFWIIFITAYNALAAGFSDDGGRTWSEARELLPDVAGPFAAASFKTSIYIAARRQNPPDIHLLSLSGQDWSGRVLFRSLPQQLVTGSPLVQTDTEGNVHVICPERPHFSPDWQARHLTLDSGGEMIREEPLPRIAATTRWPGRLGFMNDVLHWSGDLACDLNNTLHLVCRAFSGAGYALFYTRRSGAGWNDFIPLTGTHPPRGVPRTAAGTVAGSLFLVFQRGEGSGCCLSCLAMNPGGSWSSEQVIDPDVTPDTLPDLAVSAAGPVVHWSSGKGLYRRFLEGSSPAGEIISEKAFSLSAAYSGSPGIAWTPASPGPVFFSQLPGN